MKRTLWMLATAMLMVACEKAYVDTYTVEAPYVHDFMPKQGEPGAEITVIGENLQRVDSVFIGGGAASIRYRVSDTKLIIRAETTSRSGKVKVRNMVGTSESTSTFNLTYLIPMVEHYPDTGTVKQEVVLEGLNLHVVERVLIGSVDAVIVAQRKDELVFRVPLMDVTDKQTLRLVYFDGQQEQQIGPDGATFIVEKEKPVIKSCPESLTKYTPITLTGERLLLIEQVMLDDESLLIKMQSDEEMILDMPTNYFGGEKTGTLKALYYEGTKTLLIKQPFRIISDPDEPRYYTHKNVLLSAREQFGGTEESFFDAETGMVISSCSAAEYMLDIDFLLYDQAGYVQLYGPHNAANTVKNFKCDKKSIDPQDGSWQPFFLTETCFRVLKPENAAENAIIEAYKAGTIVSLDAAFFEGVTEPSSKAPRVYRSSTDAGYSNSHFSLDAYSYGWVRNFSTGKNGIIHVTAMPKDAVSGRIPELMFDIIWEK